MTLENQVDQYQRLSAQVEQLEAELKAHAAEVVGDYCRVFEKWHGNKILSVHFSTYEFTACVDTSCRGCEDWDHVSMPIEWFYMSAEDRVKHMQKARATELEEELYVAEKSRQDRLSRLKNEIAELEKENENG